MDRLITPLDGSRLAESALGIATFLAGRFGVPLELVHVIGPTTANEPPPFSSMDEAACYLQSVKRRLSDRVSINVSILEGQPVEELLQYFGQRDHALVVMSRIGRSGLGRVSFGGVTDSLVHRSPVPILLANELERPDGVGLTDILVPLDGSDLASSALPLAVEMAGDLGRICLVRVVQPPVDHSPATAPPIHELASLAIDEARSYLLGMATEIRRQGINVSWEVRFGDPSTEILRAVETAGSDLIVMATHGLAGLRGWAFGSVTAAVMHHGSTPILVIPPNRS